MILPFQEMGSDVRNNGDRRNSRALRAKTSSASWSICLAAFLATSLTGCGAKPAPPPQSVVAVFTVQPERVVMTTELPGRTRAYLIAEIRPQVNGIIKKRLFVEGSDVKSGNALYQIDPLPYQAAFDQAKGTYEMAEAALPSARLRAARLQGLVAIHAVGQQEFDDAVAALQSAEANATAAKAALDAARINLDYTPVKSPISGRIGRSNVTVGALVNAYQGVPLALVQQIDPLYVDATQSTADLLRLRKALDSGGVKTGEESQKQVHLLLEDGTLYPLVGTLEFRDVTVEPGTGSVTLRMVFPNPNHVLLPGMFVRAIVEEGIRSEAILVPQQGISRDFKGNPVGWIVNGEGVVEQRSVELDRAIGDKWLVSKGLAAGDRLIVEGLQKVRPGSSVTVVPFKLGTEANSTSSNVN